jgi:hypothetical protein
MAKIQAIPVDIKIKFDEALELSKDHNNVFISEIATKLDIAKEFFTVNAADYEELNDLLKRINTNLESNVLNGIRYGSFDSNFGKFALEAIHKWKAETDKSINYKIIVSGISEDDLEQCLDEGY